MGVACVSLILLAGPAAAQYPGGGQPPPTVRGERFFREPGGTARTGSDVWLIILAGLLLLLVGLAFRALTRRKAARDT